jgi:hypothetical protein
MRRSCVALVLVVALGGIAAGCSGDDGQSAEQQAQEAVCDDADALETAVETLIDDVENANFGDAEDQLSTVESAFDALVASAENLASEKQLTVENELSKVQDTLGGLTSLDNLADIGETLETAAAQLEAVVTTVTDTLNCNQ